jgi:transcriptional regulator with XRE-family HTH domain
MLNYWQDASFMTDPKQIVGGFIREIRNKRKMSQQALSEKSGITYQYLSEIENGKANLTLDILAAVSRALGLNLPKLVSLAFMTREATAIPATKTRFFRRATPLPGSLSFDALENVLNETQKLIGAINYNLVNLGGTPLHSLIQGNNFSGLVSNLLSECFHQHTHFKNNSHQKYPDLIDEQTGVGLEIKATIKPGKGGESHNGHSGWHLIACYEIRTDGNIEFLHVMMADLVGHNRKGADWKYVGSKVNQKTGSQRTETYTTNLEGLTKLRDGSVYLDTDRIKTDRWKPLRRKGEVCPAWSIFSEKQPASPKSVKRVREPYNGNGGRGVLKKSDTLFS